MSPALFLALAVAAGPADGFARDPEVARTCAEVAPIALGVGAGALTGSAVGVGTAFAVVYGSERNGCYVGGCDAPLLASLPA